MFSIVLKSWKTDVSDRVIPIALLSFQTTIADATTIMAQPRKTSKLETASSSVLFLLTRGLLFNGTTDDMVGNVLGLYAIGSLLTRDSAKSGTSISTRSTWP
ncbi:Hypothetical protein NTJ_13840 [Nesidiocoris tenuis]|uniref:Uncharacterized protein n=1 Tax=Nesidiocoris tenuis TaxID=355587 RepID=A0ABN7B9G2_9HEMI|nr:Hypothetical protein NTJ_13840 [Nesidiocoris tenuis]